jgi:hypothetical protein
MKTCGADGTYGACVCPGGTGGTGAVPATGGTPATGGAPATGGSPGTGGMPPATGGVPGTGGMPPATGGIPGTGGMPPATGGTGGSPVGPNCPEGIESVLPLVLTGETVPGNLELGLATVPETPRNPCGLPEEKNCFNIANQHRINAGLEPFLWDGDLADLARSHAADRNQQGNYPAMHGSSTNPGHLYQDRAEFLGLKSGKFTSVVEDAAYGVSTGQEVIDMWMASPGHRAVIMGEGYWWSLRYAACGQDGNQWNMEFAAVE